MTPKHPAKNGRDSIAHLLRLVACLLLLAAGAATQSGRILGHDLSPAPDAAPDNAPALGGGAVRLDGNVRVVDSTTLAPGVSGYGGPVPVVVRVEDGRVASVAPKLPNDETPMFFGMLESAGLWRAWDGLPPEVAATTRGDAVTSAPYSSRAAIENARAAFAAAAVAEGAAAPLPGDGASAAVSLRSAAALAVLLAAAFVPLFTKSRHWRTAQLWLDLAVLGLWSGAFLSTSRLLGWAGAGLPRATADFAAALLLIATALLWPLFGRPAHYCMHVCPFGAAQELVSRLPLRKWRLPPPLVRWLTTLRRVLWGALMLSLWLGLGARWLDWELFGAFAWRAAPPLDLALAALFVALSAFVPRPYCRFVCPTGTLFKIAEAAND